MAGTADAMLVAGLYILILLLIIVFDLRERRILNLITLPALALVLFLGLVQGLQTFYLSVLGAVTGFLVFYALFILGKRLYGQTALGFGDVKLAMLLGAMLGLQQILFTLALGILLAGTAAIFILGKRGRFYLRTTMPYGVFLACAGIIMLVWENFF